MRKPHFQIGQSCKTLQSILVDQPNDNTNVMTSGLSFKMIIQGGCYSKWERDLSRSHSLPNSISCLGFVKLE